MCLLTPVVGQAQDYKVTKLAEECACFFLQTLIDHTNKIPEQKPLFHLLQV